LNGQPLNAASMIKDYLFVYGTLLSRLNSPASLILEHYAELIAPASVQGRLYEIRGYPGLVLSDDSEETVQGEIYLIHEKQKLFTALDEYEGCSPRFPGPTEYVRKRVSVKKEGGKIVQAWAYLYNWNLLGKARIHSGDYLKQIGRG
jgi:gamma-glutamylcyclotransferase (GGCT)/AIG2-like uncharacterized protein YtfP